MVHHRTTTTRRPIVSSALLFGALLAFPAASPAAERFETTVGFKVNETGAATFSIPIEVPPGTAGMAPAISLNYSSRGDDGILGVGWSLGGLSAIYRCGRSLAQDGVKDTVNYNATDRFCLDGQRLAAVPDAGGVTGVYGANGTEYRTERESFTKVISYGAAGGGPAWFKAWTKAGQIIEFGSTADSAIQAIGKSEIRVWAVKKISDNAGNYLTVSYFEGTTSANYDYRPTGIAYTFNANTSTPQSANYVKFVYTPRLDVTSLYQAGSEIRNALLLTNVQTSTRIGAPMVVVKDYRLVYDQSPATNRSRLKSIQECDGISTTATCLPATTIGWQSSNNPFTPPANFNLRNGNLALGNKTQGHSLGDFNGDGRTDILKYADDFTQNKLYLSNGDGSFTESVNFNLKSYYLARSNMTQGYSLGDFNGDGRTDILKYADDFTQNKLYLSNGDGSFTESVNFNLKSYYLAHSNMTQGHSLGDFNGDGRTDILKYADDFSLNKLYLSNGDGSFTESVNFNLKSYYLAHSNKSQGHSPGDFNGDGKTDILKYSDTISQNKLHLSNGDGSFTESANFNLNTSTTILSASTGYLGHALGDFNGDGKTDILKFTADGSASNNLYLSTGDGSFIEPDLSRFNLKNIPLAIRDGTIGHSLGDFNGDGKTDILKYANTPADNMLYLSSGDGMFTRYDGSFLNSETLSFSDAAYTRTRGNSLGDFNGDGKTDILKYSDTCSENKLFWEQDAVANDLVLTVTTGLGTTTLLAYKPITDNTVYAKYTDAIYPYLDMQAPLNVVSMSIVPDGIGGIRSTYYTYFGAKAHLRGGGFLGFRQFDAADMMAGISTSTVFRQDYPYQGLPVSVTQKYKGALLKSIANTWGFTTYADTVLPIATATGSKHHFPVITAMLETTYDLGISGSLVTQVGTTTKYDAYGNATEATSVTNDGYSKTIINTFAPPNLSKWFIGQLTRSAVTSTAPDAVTAPPPVIVPPPPLSPTVHIAALAADWYEGNSGPVAFTFVVSRVDGDLSAGSSVNWAVTGSGANIAIYSDFFGGVLPTGTVNIAPGQAYQTFIINIQGDADFEPDEGFTVTLSSPANAILGIAAAAGVIRNDDQTPFTFTQTIAANTQGYNIRSAAIAAGWNQIDPLSATVTVNSGVYVYGASTSGYAFDVSGAFPAGSSISLINNGYILGRGGNGGAGATGATYATWGGAGGNGGTALRAQYPISITNNGIIGGGGGGGAGGPNYTVDYHGGGGGGGAPYGLGGQSGAGGMTPLATAGANATLTSSGGGGIGNNNGYFWWCSGITGGGYGQPGGNADVAGYGTWGYGGAAGAATLTTGDTFITWVTRGNISGAQSNMAPPPAVDIIALSADKAEGNSGATSFIFTVSRSGSTADTISVNWTVIGFGTNPAIAADFSGGIFPSGLLSFSVGQVSQTVIVNVLGDTAYEPNEGFAISLSNPTNTTLGIGIVAGTIQNDDVAPPPSVGITAPTADSVLTIPANITITAAAADVDGNIAKVEFYDNGTLLGADTAAPYTYAWNNVPDGAHQITAKATDNLGTSTTSAVVAFTVTAAPAVSITAPAVNSAFLYPASITIAAAATDSDGTISKIEFYNSTTLLGTSTVAPYSYSWSNPALGSYVLTTKATDNLGAVTTSAAVTVNVVNDIDLVMTAVSTDAASVVSGSSLAINNTEKNQGTVVMTVSSNTIKFYLSADATITSTDITLTGSRTVVALAAGADSAATTAITVPKTVAPGIYYVGACADAGLAQAETNETNNCSAAATTIAVIRDVDLVMAAVSTTTASVPIGTSFIINNSEKNQGTTNMTASSNSVRFYLSTDDVITSADTLLTGSRLVPALAAGADSGAAATSVKVPTTVPGTYYVGACADAANAQPETYETNNCSAAASTITVIRDVDLVMTAVSTAATSVGNGLAFAINSTEVNQGTNNMTSTSNTIKFYLSVDATITSTDITLTGSRSVALALAAGASSAATTSVTVPRTATPGTYYIGAIADAMDVQPETNETNNALAGGTISVMLNIDLVISALSTSATSVGVGGNFTIYSTEKNQGTVNMTATSNTVRFYLSPDATITTADWGMIGSRTVVTLAAGADSGSALTTLTVPAAVPPGTYYVGAIADAADVQLEANESNNALAATTIVVTP